MPHTILWPTELSASSLKAIPHINSLAEKYESQVLALYVAPDLCSLFPAYGNYPSPEKKKKFQGWELERAKKDLRQICADKLGSCPNVSVRILRGDPVQQILKAAENEDVDMIVMTSRGHSFDQVGRPGSEFGKVAREVAKRSPVPVTLVNPEAEAD